MSAPSSPDLEAWVWENIKHLAGVTSFAFAASTDWPGWQTRVGIQIDCRAARKKPARDLAEEVRRLMVELPEVPWTEGQITYATVAEGPTWLPDDNDGAPRYTIRVEFRVHPNRTGGVLMDA